ncbi:HAMP domain-containing protein [Lampropedia aestuarii]|uniref:histidine kinase n=1 Tax=Lampropedia aestuarii TaxID=2562762 RepID=A0A4S5BUD8_9BURK|nr:ATP-binding protein [Lampropedia aestuarii]THJ34933.1 HAMP domain-containing protein [Lampropedia aestuarii]
MDTEPPPQAGPLSVYRQLLRWIGGAASIGGICLLVAAYFFQLEEINEISNENLKQIALAATLSMPVTGCATVHIPHNLPRFIEEDDGNNFVTQIFDTQHNLRASSTPDVLLPPGEDSGLRHIQLGKQRWWVYTVITPDGIAVAGQNSHLRQLTVQALALKLIVVLAIMLALLGGLLHWALRRGLKPLQHVADAIGTRSADSLAPLTVANYPQEIRTIIEALNQLMDRLQQALHAQQRFIADAAHELRTPVTALRLQLQLLQRAQGAERRHQAEQELAQGIARIERLVLQLLDLSRIEPHSVPQLNVDLQTLCEDVLERYRAVAQHKSIALDLQVIAASGVSDALRPVLQGDATALGMVVSNLTDNALRYTPAHGQVGLQICLHADHVELTVQDSGPGIAKAEYTRVFDRFYRINQVHGAADAGAEVGSGIGLAIVKQTVERHGGQIRLGQSDWGGLLVTVHLPLPKAAVS